MGVGGREGGRGGVFDDAKRFLARSPDRCHTFRLLDQWRKSSESTLFDLMWTLDSAVKRNRITGNLSFNATSTAMFVFSGGRTLTKSY